MATKKKKDKVKELNQLFADSQVLIFTDYRGLKVSDITSLRRQLRDKGVDSTSPRTRWPSLPPTVQAWKT